MNFISSSRPYSLATRLMSLVLGSMVALALVTAALTSFLLSTGVESSARGFLRATAQEIAQTSRPAFAAASDVVPTRALETVRSAAPGIIAAAFLDPGARPLASVGEFSAIAIDEAQLAALSPGDSSARLRDGPNDTWQVIAPVWLTPDRSPFDVVATTEHVGYVYIVWDRSLISRARWRIVGMTFGVGVLLLLVLSFFVRRIVAHLTRPLDDLAAVMRDVTTSEALPRVSPSGARELRDIATAYNTLAETIDAQIRRIDAQTNVLETEVAARTRDLQEALQRAETTLTLGPDRMITIMHQIRTPLHSIIGSLRQAEEESLFFNASTLTNCLQQIRSSVDVLRGNLTDLMSLSRNEATPLLHISPLALKLFVEQLETLIRPIAAESDNTFTTSYGDITTHTVFVDARRLHYVLTNLLTNACKFTVAGRIDLTVRNTPGALIFTVKDTGRGIPPSQQSEMFQIFRQGARDLAHNHNDGAGIGLALCKRYCELMGGTLTLDSAVGVGSTFTVHLPLRDGRLTVDPSLIVSTTPGFPPPPQ